MKKSIDLAAKSPLLSNYKIYATKSCQPAPKEIKGNILKELIQIGIKSIVKNAVVRNSMLIIILDFRNC